MDNSGDSARALILLMLIMFMIQIDSVQSDTVECPTSPSPPECAKDCNGDIWFFHQGKGSCQQCPKCGPGQGLDNHCGGQSGQHAKCEPCIPGETFTDMNWCRPCRLCDNTVSDSPCNPTTDAVCGKCRTGYYHYKGKPDQCHPCGFLSQPELEPQCQLPQKLTTDPRQEGSEESSTTDAMLQPTLPAETPAQETNYVSPSPRNGDLSDNGFSSTILSTEEEAGESTGRADIASEPVVAAAVPSSLHPVFYVILVICVTLLMVKLMTVCLHKIPWINRQFHCYMNTRNPPGATSQHRPQTDYVTVTVEDSEDVAAVDDNAQTAFYIRFNQHDKAGESSGNRGGLSHARLADSVSRSFTSLFSGSTLYSNPAKQESFSGKDIISPGSLPGKASNGGTQHPTTDGWNRGVDSRPSMVTSASPVTLCKENGIDIDKASTYQASPTLGVTDVTLCKENGIDIDKPSIYQASPNLGVTDGAVSSAAVVVDVTADILHSSSPPPADTHADAALPTTDESSAAAATAVGADTDGAKRENSPLIKSATSKKSCKFRVRVAPSDLDSANGSKEHSASSSNKPCIHVNGSSNNVYCIGDYSNLNIGFKHTDTESD